jgi:long-chain fatty acid transport protein
MRGWKLLPVLLVLLFSSSTSFAAGFRLPEAGVKAMGMGFAFTAQADDPSAIYFNPAGLTQLKGQNVMVGGTYVRENGGEFTGTTPVDDFGAGFTTIKSETQKNLNFFIPNAYYTRTANSGYIAYGVGIFAPFGLGQEYKDKHSSIFRNQITKIDLQTVVVNPTIAFKINEFLSVGVGIDWMYGKAELERTPWSPLLVAFQNGNAFDLKLDGDGDAWGYNFGLLVKPSTNFRIGASYRSPFTLDIKNGDVTLSNIHPGVAPALAGLTTTKGSATVSIPATFALGAAYTMGKLTVEADADWTFWHSYRSLPIDFQDNRPVLPDSNAPKNWHDVVALRLGAEFRVTDPLALRAGFAYDPSPVPAGTMGPELPDADRFNYMVGAGYKIANWTIDGAFMYVDKFDRTVNNQQGLPILTGFNGTWTGDAWLVGLDVGYNF